MGRCLHVYTQIVITIGLLSLNLYGEELNQAFVPVRALGMGGAFTAVAQDNYSIWTNPGGISRIRKNRSRKRIHYIAFPKIVGGANKEGLKLYYDIKKDRLEDNTEKTANTIESATSNTKPIWATIGTNLSLFFELERGSPYVIAPFMSYKASLMLEEATNNVDITTVSDTGVILGAGFSNNTNRLTAGIQIRPIKRYDYSDKLALSKITDRKELLKRIKEDSNSTSGVAIDIGALYTLADFWFPTIGLSILNMPLGCKTNYLNPYTEERQKICGTVFTGNINNKESLYKVDPTDIRVGIAITPRLGRNFAMRVAFDLHHMFLQIGDQYYGLPGVTTLQQFHGGIEFFWGNPLLPSPLSLQLGYSQGWVSAGFSIDIGALSLEIATYGIDISTGVKPREDRRSVFAFTLEY